MHKRIGAGVVLLWLTGSYLVAAAPGFPRGPANVVELLEDDAIGLIAQLDNDGGLDATEVRLDYRDFYSGVSSVRVTPFQRFGSKLRGWNYEIAEKPRAGQYRYIRFAWKRLQGDGIMLQLHSAENAWNQRYLAGKQAPTTLTWGAILTITPIVPTDWTVVTRDLYKDFGAITITGMALTPMYGGAAGLFDHLYLGKSVADLDLASAAVFGRESSNSSLTEAQLVKCWENLGSRNVKTAASATRTLLAGRKNSVSFLARRLQSDRQVVEAKAILGWLEDLDDDAFERREKATRELTKLGDRAAPYLRRALVETRSPEVRQRVRRLLASLSGEEGSSSPEELRTLRAIRILEWSATPDARKALEALARGNAAGVSASDLREALARMKKATTIEPREK